VKETFGNVYISAVNVLGTYSCIGEHVSFNVKRCIDITQSWSSTPQMVGNVYIYPFSKEHDQTLVYLYETKPLNNVIQNPEESRAYIYHLHATFYHVSNTITFPIEITLTSRRFRTENGVFPKYHMPNILE
jgi:hypothetical protein